VTVAQYSGEESSAGAAVCYSAQIWADYKKFTRQFGAILSIGDFTRIFW
jgi:hypothetical protein